MPVDIPKSDLSRSPSADTDREFPDYVVIRLVWGKKERGHIISAEEFFGSNGVGAPISGDAVIAHINRLRRMGRPE